MTYLKQHCFYHRFVQSLHLTEGICDGGSGDMEVGG